MIAHRLGRPGREAEGRGDRVSPLGTGVEHCPRHTGQRLSQRGSAVPACKIRRGGMRF